MALAAAADVDGSIGLAKPSAEVPCPSERPTDRTSFIGLGESKTVFDLEGRRAGRRVFRLRTPVEAGIGIFTTGSATLDAAVFSEDNDRFVAWAADGGRANARIDARLPPGASRSPVTTAEHYTDALDLAAAAKLQIDRAQSRGLQQYRDLRARLEVERDRVEGAFADPLESGGYGPEMVLVPAGRFYMGCPADDDRCGQTEKPVRRVRVAAFAMSRHEATFAEWDACVAAKGCRGYLPPDETWGTAVRDRS